MIIFDLQCGGGHVFEAWFGSTGDFHDQQARGLVHCPLCGAGEVRKAVMAPRLAAKGNRSRGEAPTNDPERAKALLAKLATAQRNLLAGSDFVGARFADEARAIHLGEAESRAIHGQATSAQARSLLDEGIGVAPLPFPVVAPGDEN